MPTPRKPDYLHRLTGTKSQASTPAPASTPESGRPKFPADLRATGPAKSAFRRLCKMLEARRVITPGDAELLRLYAYAFDRHARALLKLAEEGEIRIYYRLDCHGEQCPSEKQNLWLRVAQDSEKFMVGVLDRLGLTPLNKGKVLPAQEPVAAPVDPLDAAMNKKPPAAAEPVLNLEDVDEDLVVN